MYYLQGRDDTQLPSHKILCLSLWIMTHPASADAGLPALPKVRYDRVVGSTTSLKFMTDGILLREVQEDFLLKRYDSGGAGVFIVHKL